MSSHVDDVINTPCDPNVTILFIKTMITKKKKRKKRKKTNKRKKNEQEQEQDRDKQQQQKADQERREHKQNKNENKKKKNKQNKNIKNNKETHTHTHTHTNPVTMRTVTSKIEAWICSKIRLLKTLMIAQNCACKSWSCLCMSLCVNVRACV
jgi:hypothetical protein